MNSTDQAVLAGPHSGLLDWLASHHIEYELHEHERTYTARETARAEHVNPQTFAKAVAVVTEDGRRALMVLEAADRLDLHRARHALGASHVRLMTEAELAAACSGCELGAMPPVGALFRMPTWADYAIREARVITFQAGSHTFAVQADRERWERAAGVVYASLAEDRLAEPAWLRS